jgi:hypothetical protein
MKLQDTAFIAAIATTIWNSAQLYRLRRRLRIETGIVPILGVWTKKQMLITVTNMAIRPITVLEVRGCKSWIGSKRSIKTGEIMVRPEGWPVTLHEGDRVGAVIDRYEDLCSGKYGYLYVRDSVGKRWRIRRKMRLKLIKQAADHRPFPAPDRIIEERGDGTRITHIVKKDV